jgi:hypothetical protein
MKTQKNNSNSKIKALLALSAISAALVFLTSIILHIDPLNMANSIVDFATHHYFLMGFISLITMALCVKLYKSMDERIERNYNNKNMIGYTRLKKRKKTMQSIREQFFLKAQKLKSHYVEKDQIQGLQFSKNEVLSDKEELILREQELQRAMKLGNTLKQKVKIFFKDQKSNKYIETTVWHANSNHVVLKGGITIPVNRIYKVEI